MLFYSPVAWLVLIIFTFQSGMIFSGMIEMIEREQAMGYDTIFISASLFNRLFYNIQDYLFLYIPLLTMGLVSRDLAGGTIKFLHSSPMTNSQIILGKFLSMMIFALLLVGIFVLYVIYSLFVVENFDLCYILTGILGIYLLICTYASIGLFMSTISSYQIIAAVAGAAALLLAYLMPSLRRMFTTGSAVALALFTALAAVLSVVAGLRSRSFTLGCLTFAGCCAALTVLFLLRSSWLTEGFSAVLSALCLFAPFEEFANSNFSIPTLVYYLTVTVLFLFFTVQELEKRRWN